MTSIGTFLQSLLNILETDVAKTAGPVLLQFLQNIIGNSAPANIVAQLAALQVNLLAALPNLEQAVAKDIATLLQTQLTALLAAAPSAAPAPAH